MKKITILLALSLSILLVGCSETKVENPISQDKTNEEYPDQRTPEEMKESSWALTTQGVLTESDWGAIEGEQNLLEMTKVAIENSAKAAQLYRHKVVTVNAVLTDITGDGKDMFEISSATNTEIMNAEWDSPLKYSSMAYVNKANKDKIAATLAEKNIDEPIKFKALVIGASNNYVFEVIEVY